MGITVRMKYIETLYFFSQDSFSAQRPKMQKRDKNKQKWIVKSHWIALWWRKVSGVYRIYTWNLSVDFTYKRGWMYMHLTDFRTVINTCWRNLQHCWNWNMRYFHLHMWICGRAWEQRSYKYLWDPECTSGRTIQNKMHKLNDNFIHIIKVEVNETTFTSWALSFWLMFAKAKLTARINLGVLYRIKCI